MIIRKSSKEDIKVRAALAACAGIGTSRVLVACDGADMPMAYCASAVDKVGTLHVIRVAAFDGCTPEMAVNACSALLRELTASNANKPIRIGHKHVDSLMSPVLAQLGFRELREGYARQANKVDTTWYNPFVVVAADDEEKTGIVLDIEAETKGNTDFRRVLYTGENLQLVLMSLAADEEIGMETHEDNDQFFRVDSGSGTCVIGGVEHKIKNGSAFVIPAGTAHNVIAAADGLKVYSLYAPPHHADGTVHKTKADAEADTEEFDEKTTEK